MSNLSTNGAAAMVSSDTLLEVKNLKMHFPIMAGFSAGGRPCQGGR
ncbi:MAG: hypothetical protein R3E79_58160 [Caldilineaceae bacterium]